MLASKWHAELILDKNVNMNTNYGYPTTMYESILAQMYVFLVLSTFFAFPIKYFESQNCKKKKNIFLPEICTFRRKYSYIFVRVENCSSCSCK